MLELGEGAAAAHTGVGAYAAEVGVDVLVTVGPARGRHRAGLRGGRRPGGVAITTAGRDAAVEWLRHNVSAADVVLVKASRGAALELIADDLLTGSGKEGRSTR